MRPKQYTQSNHTGPSIRVFEQCDAPYVGLHMVHTHPRLMVDKFLYLFLDVILKSLQCYASINEWANAVQLPPITISWKKIVTLILLYTYPFWLKLKAHQSHNVIRCRFFPLNWTVPFRVSQSDVFISMMVLNKKSYKLKFIILHCE